MGQTHERGHHSRHFSDPKVIKSCTAGGLSCGANVVRRQRKVPIAERPSSDRVNAMESFWFTIPALTAMASMNVSKSTWRASGATSALPSAPSVRTSLFIFDLRAGFRLQARSPVDALPPRKDVRLTGSVMVFHSPFRVLLDDTAGFPDRRAYDCSRLHFVFRCIVTSHQTLQYERRSLPHHVFVADSELSGLFSFRYSVSRLSDRAHTLK